tara:strand:+ start:4151 stop:5590 length:1440 start_codon:yes stop_codon:yes gene_type:complete
MISSSSSQKFAGVSPPKVGVSSRRLFASSRAKAAASSGAKFPRRLPQKMMPMRASPTRFARPRVVVALASSSSGDFGKESSSASSSSTIENQTEEEEEEEEEEDAVVPIGILPVHLYRKLLVQEGRSLTKRRMEDARAKRRLKKRQKKLVLNASEIGTIKMPSELFGMRRVKVPGTFEEEEDEDEEEEEDEEDAAENEDDEDGNRATTTTKKKKKKKNKKKKMKVKMRKSLSKSQRRISYSASECSDFGQRFPIDSIVVVNPENGEEQTTRISDLTVKTFLRDAVELLPQCAPLGLQFGDFRSAVSQSYDSNDEDKESCFRGDVCYRFLKTKRNEEKIIVHPVSFERKERTKDAKETECNLESNDGWPFAFRLSLTDDKKYIQLEMRVFWPKNELLKYGKEALERDGKHRFDVFSKNVESMLYYMERGVVGRGVHSSSREDDAGKNDSSDVVKELSARMKRRLGRAPFVTEIARELERL